MKSQNKNKVKELLGRLNSLENSFFPDMKSLSDEIINKEYASVTDQVKNNSTIKMLDVLNEKLVQFKTDFDVKSIRDAIQEFQKELLSSKEEINNQLSEISLEANSKLLILQKALDDSRIESQTSNGQNKQELLNRITALEGELQMVSDRKVEIPNFGNQIGETEKKLRKLINTVKSEVEGSDKSQGLQAQITDVQDSIKKLRIDLLSRLSERGAGNMNRQILIGGVNPLTRYTDINWKAGSNITLTYANNDTTKRVDVTITAAGGGSGSGIVRSINSVSTPTAAGNATTTDYVYLVSGTTTITLPDASLNTNLYTIKNVGNGTVTVATTSAQTIDGSLTITLPVKYTSVDIESDGSNWNVT